MIEFTMSRVVLCICGVMILASAMAVMDSSEERTTDILDSDVADRVVRILDTFEASVAQELVLDGRDVLPSEDCILEVTDHIVSLESGSGTVTRYTVFGQDFELSYDGSVTLRKSVPEGVGDLPDGVGEDVDLLGAVVDVRRCPGAPLDPSGYVERVGTVHS